MRKTAAVLLSLSILLLPACASAEKEKDKSAESKKTIQKSESKSDSDRKKENDDSANKQEETAADQEENASQSESSENGKVTFDGTIYSVDGILIVNKKYGLPADYAPGENPEASAALAQLISAMQSQGLSVSNSYSGFRSYEYQNQLYNGYVAANGQESADTFSARPGFSEHQTGLAFDLMDAGGALLTLPTESAWLLEHAPEYGFIVRYQEGKESITGYQAEPWHIRYIGERAKEIADSGLTLEEFLGVEGGDYRQ